MKKDERRKIVIKRKPKAIFKAEEDHFNFFINGKDETDEVSAVEYEGTMYVYHHPSGDTYFLLDYWNCVGKDEWYNAEYFGNDYFAFYFYDGEGFLFIVRGENANDEVQYSEIDGHLLVYIPATGESFFGYDFEENADNELTPLSYIDQSEFVPIWYVHDGEKVLHKGRNMTNEVEAAYLGENLYVYVPEDNESFFLEDARSFDDGEFQAMASFGEDNVPIFYRTDEGFQLVRHGQHLGAESTACDTGEGVLIYHPGSGITYFTEGGLELESGDWMVAAIIGEGVDAFWKSDGEHIWLAFHGTPSSSEDLRIVPRGENMVVIMDVAREITFGVEDFESKCDGLLRAAEL